MTNLNDNLTLPADVQNKLADNWAATVDDVRSATVDAGRDANDVTIVGVTKYVDEALTAGLVRCGCHDLGENRPQVLWRKAEAFAGADDLTATRWHAIGHLQTNKVRRVLRYGVTIHSIDSQRLLEAVARESLAATRVTNCLLEINISGDLSKTGLVPDVAMDLLQRYCHAAGIKITGLMAMAGLGTA